MHYGEETGSRCLPLPDGSVSLVLVTVGPVSTPTGVLRTPTQKTDGGEVFSP